MPDAKIGGQTRSYPASGSASIDHFMDSSEERPVNMHMAPSVIRRRLE